LFWRHLAPLCCISAVIHISAEYAPYVPYHYDRRYECSTLQRNRTKPQVRTILARFS